MKVSKILIRTRQQLHLNLALFAVVVVPLQHPAVFPSSWHQRSILQHTQREDPTLMGSRNHLADPVPPFKSEQIIKS